MAPFERTTRQRPRSRWGAAAASLQRAGPIEALTVYLEHQKVDPERRAVLVRHAKALMGEDDPMEATVPGPPHVPPEGDAGDAVKRILPAGGAIARVEADSPGEALTLPRAEGVALPS